MKNLLFLFLMMFGLSNAQTYNVALTSLTLQKYGVVNTDYVVGAIIKNNGSTRINSVTMNWNDGVDDHIATIDTGSLYAGQSREISHPALLNYATMVSKNITITVTQVDGNPDSNPADNILNTTFSTVSQLSPKKVLIEEGTGTWCGWCPRGAVAMADMDAEFPDDFTGIAVHNSDPMVVAAYNSGSSFSGYPQMNVDRSKRRQNVSTADMRNHITERKRIVTPAELNASGTLVGNVLTFNASAIFRANLNNADLRFSVVLVEDDVRGTTSGYAQRNYYAGGGNGPMGGYENLPDPVPAAQMVYDHVGRMLLGGYAGQAGSIPATIQDGQVVNFEFSATIPTTMNLAKMKAVILLLDGSNGEVVNTRPFLLSTLGVSTVETNKNYLTAYPNPTTDFIRIQANYNVDVQIFDASGKLVLSQSNVAADRNISVSSLQKGVYMVKIHEKGTTNTKSQN